MLTWQFHFVIVNARIWEALIYIHIEISFCHCMSCYFTILLKRIFLFIFHHRFSQHKILTKVDSFIFTMGIRVLTMSVCQLNSQLDSFMLAIIFVFFCWHLNYHLNRRTLTHLFWSLRRVWNETTSILNIIFFFYYFLYFIIFVVCRF